MWAVVVLVICLLLVGWFLLLEIMLVLLYFFFPSNFARELASGNSAAINYVRSLIFGITQ